MRWSFAVVAICFMTFSGGLSASGGTWTPSESIWTPLGQQQAPAEATARVISETSDQVTVEIEIPGFSKGEIVTDLGTFAALDIPGCGRTTVVGQAWLPVLRRAVEIPQGSAPRVEVIRYSSTPFELGKLGLPARVMPVQEPIEKLPGAQEAAEFRLSESFYRSAKPYPGYFARISETGQMRGHRYAFIEVAPVRYSPAQGTVEILSSITVRVTTPDADPARTRATRDRYGSPRFDQAASRILLNYKAPTVTAVPEWPVGYLIITDPGFYTEIQPLAEWKNSKGYQATVTQTSDIPGGATTTAIRDYIFEAWDTWEIPPSFVLLVGDVEDIPNWVGTETDNPPTDLYYGTMTDPDYIPDLGVGRFSVTSPAEAASLVEKIVEYEKLLFGGTAWLKKAVFMASEDNWTITEGTHDYVISNYLDAAGYASDKLYCHTYNATTQQVRDAYNEGRGLGIYSGHGATTYWDDGPYFTQGDVQGLTNLDMYPFVQSYACYTGRYTESECFAETWIREAGKAGLGFWASSVTSYWDEDDVLEKGVFRALFEDSLTWISGMTDQGKWYVHEYYGGAGSTKRYYEMYNLMGDPSLDVWTDSPTSMTVTHAGACPVGATSYAVHVEAAGTPVSEAMVCVSMPGGVYETAYTDPAGDANLALDPAPSVVGNMYLTVTCHNHAPALDTIAVVVPAIVTIDPDTVQVQTPTPVTITVVDTLLQPIEDVVVTIDGWGFDPALGDTTDALGQVVITVDAPYGEVLTVTGRQIGETYDAFSEPLVVAGAAALTNPRIEAGVELIGLVGALTPGFAGIITGRAEHTGLDMYALGCGIDRSAFSAEDSVVIEAMPTGLGHITVALTYPGYEVYMEAVEVIEAYGRLAGTITDVSSGDSLPDVAVAGYEAGTDTSATPAVFETVTAGDGTYTTPNSIPVGYYDIYAVRFGYLAFAGSALVQVGDNVYDFGMTPAPSGIVSGTVTEEITGRPITATMDIYRSDDMSLYSQAYSDSLSGGTYSTAPLPYFTYVFKVSADHYMTRYVNVTVDEAAETVDIELTPTEGNLLVIDDDTGDRTFETKLGPKGRIVPFDGEHMVSGTKATSATLIAQDLAGLGYDVTSETSASTDPGTWGDYDIVIWSSGDDTSPVSNGTYRAALNAYAAGLGKILIEGGEIGYDAASTPGYPNFADTTLHIMSWQHDSSGNLTVALPSHPIATTPNTLPATLTMTYSNYGDQDALTPGADTKIVFDWSSYGGQGGVLVYDDNPDPASAQIVFYSFDYTNVTDSTARCQLLENTVAHLLAEESAPEGAISGHVVLSGETSSDGVIVRTSPGGQSDTTDASGYYLIDELYDAIYQVTASKAGFSDSTVTAEVTGGGTVENVNFTLYPVLEYTADPEMAIPDNNSTGIKVYIDVPADATIASLDCYINLTHTYKGDLLVELTSPENTTVRLHNRTGSSADNIITWYDIETEPDGPGSMDDFIGEWAEGQWELHIADLAGSDLGTLHSWALRIAFPPETSGAEDMPLEVPRVHFLAKAYPNPFLGLTRLRFGLPKDESVELTVYDVQGRRVTIVTSGLYPAGIHSAAWDGTDSYGRPVAGGVYFCRLRAGSFTATQRIVHMK
jgi:subtilisin-like proprotein convertase family protein